METQLAQAFLTIGVLVGFVYACAWVAIVFYDWRTGWKLLQDPQATDESGE